jgi:hypothetical protein
MPWLNDLASGLGIPAGAAIIAGAMYAGCVAAEQNLRPEALTDVRRILQDSTWTQSTRPSALIERLFIWTFGERHLSWKCIKWSLFATIIFITAISVKLYLTAHRQPFEHFSFIQLSDFIFVSILPDYAALAKTRLLLRSLHTGSIIIIISDMVLSLLISLAFLFTYIISLYFIGLYNEYGTFSAYFAFVVHVFKYEASWIFAPSQGKYYAEYDVFLLSTLLTSVWTALVLLATAVLKVSTPALKTIAWLYDVENHPIQAIGITIGALLMIGSLVWVVGETILRTIF